MQIKERIYRHVETLLPDLGLCLWGIEAGRGSHPTIRIFVEGCARNNSEENSSVCGKLKKNEHATCTGASIEQCAELSRRLGLALEVDDIFPHAWTLEVSSPGLERQFFNLEQMHPYIGQEVEIILHSPRQDIKKWAGRKTFCGILQNISDTVLQIDLESNSCNVEATEHCSDTKINIPWNDVRRARLIYHFVRPEKPGKKKKTALKKVQSDKGEI